MLLLFNLTEIAYLIYLFIYLRISNALQETGSFDVQLAKQQHEQYCTLLREIGLDVIELPPDDALPEGVFVESSAVICNGVALIGRSENAKRRREADSMAIILKKELDIPIIEIDDPHAQLDGGDVLFTGKSQTQQTILSRIFIKTNRFRFRTRVFYWNFKFHKRGGRSCCSHGISRVSCDTDTREWDQTFEILCNHGRARCAVREHESHLPGNCEAHGT